MILLIETLSLWIVFFVMCFLGTGTDEKNLKSFSSYPEQVQNAVRKIPEYQGKFREISKGMAFVSNLILFLIVLFVLGLFVREDDFLHNFICLTILGQGLNLFDLLVIDLLWWRNSQRTRFSKIPEKEPYHNPRKHIEAFGRAFLMYLLIAMIDGWLLTLF